MRSPDLRTHRLSLFSAPILFLAASSSLGLVGCYKPSESEVSEAASSPASEAIRGSLFEPAQRLLLSYDINADYTVSTNLVQKLDTELAVLETKINGVPEQEAFGLCSKLKEHIAVLNVLAISRSEMESNVAIAAERVPALGLVMLDLSSRAFGRGSIAHIAKPGEDYTQCEARIQREADAARATLAEFTKAYENGYGLLPADSSARWQVLESYKVQHTASSTVQGLRFVNFQKSNREVSASHSMLMAKLKAMMQTAS